MGAIDLLAEDEYWCAGDYADVTIALPKRTKSYALLPGQEWLFRQTKRYACLGGGVGSGKTDGGSLHAIDLHRKIPPDTQGLICANTYGQLVNATLYNFFRLLDFLEIPYDYVQSPHRRITLFGRSILCYSLNDPHVLSGSEYAWAWIDEAYGTTSEAWDIIKARLRQVSRALPAFCGHMGFLTTTLNGYDWIYEEFVKKVSGGRNGEDHAFQRCSTFDNIHVDPLYQASLLRTYDPMLARQMLYGEFIPVGVGLVYAGQGMFSRFLHAARKIKLSVHLPLDWSLDFNINPMCSVIGQFHNNTIYITDEIVLPTSSTWDVVAVFAERYKEWRGTIRIFGDPAGNARQTATQGNISNYDVIRKELRKAFPHNTIEFHVPSAHPGVMDSINSVRACIRTVTGKRNFFIDPSCQDTIQDIESVAFREGTRDIDKRDTTGKPRTHPTDAVRYYIHALRPVSASRIARYKPPGGSVL